MNHPSIPTDLPASDVSAAEPHSTKQFLPRVLRSSFWMLNSNLFGRVLNLVQG